MLILASASPRRRELLRLICPDFEMAPSAIEERLEPGDLGAAVARLALRKAATVAASVRHGVVLGADTIVVIGGDPLGKPRDLDEARVMLRRLRGHAHEVMTGVAVVDAAMSRERSLTVVSRVLMTDYSDPDIDSYVASGEPLDKAGAYAVQGIGGRLIAGIVGSYTNVVGLPLAATRDLLANFGIGISRSGRR